MNEVKRGPAGDLTVVVGWLALLWAIFIVDIFLRSTMNIWLANWFGIQPRTTHGLIGIITAHALHGNLPHIIANSIGLLLLGFVSCGYSRSLTGAAVGYSMLTAGIFTWCLGSWNHPTASLPAVHVGASGIVFGLIGFLVANGIFRRGCMPILLAIFVFLFYGGALLGVLPPPPDENGKVAPISWEMHLGGLIGGIMASWHLRKEKA